MEKVRERGKHQCVVASLAPPPGGLARNLGMCSDWESNWWPFGSQACAQSTELHQPGHVLNSYMYSSLFVEMYFLFVCFFDFSANSLISTKLL